MKPALTLNAPEFLKKNHGCCQKIHHKLQQACLNISAGIFYSRSSLRTNNETLNSQLSPTMCAGDTLVLTINFSGKRMCPNTLHEKNLRWRSIKSEKV